MNIKDMIYTAISISPFILNKDSFLLQKFLNYNKLSIYSLHKTIFKSSNDRISDSITNQKMKILYDLCIINFQNIVSPTFVKIEFNYEQYNYQITLNSFLAITNAYKQYLLEEDVESRKNIEKFTEKVIIPSFINSILNYNVDTDKLTQNDILSLIYSEKTSKVLTMMFNNDIPLKIIEEFYQLLETKIKETGYNKYVNINKLINNFTKEIKNFHSQCKVFYYLPFVKYLTIVSNFEYINLLKSDNNKKLLLLGTIYSILKHSDQDIFKIVGQVNLEEIPTITEMVKQAIEKIDKNIVTLIDNVSVQNDKIKYSIKEIQKYFEENQKDNNIIGTLDI
ncbi:MAG: hypothetical protein N2505_00310 [Endomicrobia bacterium]|nr:hypothetical protein [Endomicrobiia bacterium]